MADAVADLLIKIDATTASLRREMERADKTVLSSTQKIQRSLDKIDKRFAQLGRGVNSVVTSMGALAGALAIRELTQFGRNALSAAENLSDMAKNVDVSVERLQALRFAFDQNGGSAAQMDQALERFNRRVGLAREGTGAAAKAVENLGLALTTASGAARPTEEIFAEVVDNIAALENGADRAALASQFFGDRVGPKLAVLLAQGNVALEQYQDELRDLGALMSGELVDKAAAASARLRALQDAFATSIQTAFLDEVIDEFGSVENSMRSVMELADDFGRGVGQAFLLLSDAAETLADNIELVAAAGGALIGLRLGSVLGRLAGVVGGVTGAFIAYNKAIGDANKGTLDALSTWDQLEQELSGVQSALETFVDVGIEGLARLADDLGLIDVAFDDLSDGIARTREPIEQAGVSIEELDRQAATLQGTIDAYGGAADSAATATRGLGGDSKTTANLLALEAKAADLAAQALAKVVAARNQASVAASLQATQSGLVQQFESGLLSPDDAVRASILIDQYSEAIGRANAKVNELTGESEELNAALAKVRAEIAAAAAASDGSGSGSGSGGLGGAARKAAAGVANLNSEFDKVQPAARDADEAIRLAHEELARLDQVAREFAFEPFIDALHEVDNAFETLVRDTLSGAEDAFENFWDRVESGLLDLAASLIANPLRIPVLLDQIFGSSSGPVGSVNFGSFGSINAGEGGGGGFLDSFGSASDIVSLGSSLFSSGTGTALVGGFNSLFPATAASIGFSAGGAIPSSLGAVAGQPASFGALGNAVSGGLNAATSIAGLGAGLLGNYIGGLIVEPRNPLYASIGGAVGGTAGAIGGAALGSALGLGAGAATGAATGVATGAAVGAGGALAGAAAGSVVPIIGTLIGAILGTVAGSFIGPKPSSSAGGAVFGSDGSLVTVLGDEATAENRELAQTLGNAGASTLALLAAATGQENPLGAISATVSNRVSDGNAAVLNFAGNYGTQGDRPVTEDDPLFVVKTAAEAQAAAFQQFLGDQETLDALAPDIRDALLSILPKGANDLYLKAGHEGVGLGQDVLTAFDIDPEELQRIVAGVADLTQARQQLEALDAPPEFVSTAETAFNALIEPFDTAIENIEAAGLKADEALELRTRSTEDFAEGFDLANEAINRALRGEGFLDEVLAQVNAFQDVFSGAEFLKGEGFDVDTSVIEENLSLALDEAISGLTFSELESLQAFVAEADDGSARFDVAMARIAAAIDNVGGAAGEASELLDQFSAQEIASIHSTFEGIFGASSLDEQAIGAGLNSALVELFAGLDGRGLVAGSDTVAALGDEILALSEDGAEANAALRLLSGALVQTADAADLSRDLTAGLQKATTGLTTAMKLNLAGLEEGEHGFRVLSELLDKGAISAEGLANITAYLADQQEVYAANGADVLAIQQLFIDLLPEQDAAVNNIARSTSVLSDYAAELRARAEALNEFQEGVIERTQGEDAARDFRLVTAGLGDFTDELDALAGSGSLGAAKNQLAALFDLVQGSGLSSEQVQVVGQEAMAVFDAVAQNVANSAEAISGSTLDIQSAFEALSSEITVQFQTAQDIVLDAATDSISLLQSETGRVIAELSASFARSISDLQRRQSEFEAGAAAATDLLEELVSLGTTPEEAFAIAQARFEDVATRAGAGDLGAINVLSEEARNFLDAARRFAPEGTPQFAEALEQARSAAEAAQVAATDQAASLSTRIHELEGSLRDQTRRLERAVDREIDAIEAEANRTIEQIRQGALLTIEQLQAVIAANELTAEQVAGLAEEARSQNLSLRQIDARIKQLAAETRRGNDLIAGAA